MKYIVCEKPGKLSLEDKSPPVKVAGEALLKVKKIGICGTDLHAYAGNQAFFSYPRILGHEIAAEIIEIEENTDNLQPGDRVVVLPYKSCGNCVACRNGKSNCCSSLRVLGVHTDGGMQEQISVPADMLVPSSGLSHKELAVVEPLSIGAHAIRRSQLKPGETILVMGCGPIGLGILIQARLLGARVIAMDTNPQRLQLVRNELGINDTITADGEALTRLMDLTGNDMADVVFDATGNKAALEAGPDYMAHGGRYVLVGLSKGVLSFEHPKIHAKEISLLCSRNATREDFQQVMALMKNGSFPLDHYITHEVPFSSMIGVFEDWLNPDSGTIKALVDF